MDMARKYKQGHYTPKNPEKCMNSGVLTYRSSWELHVFEFLDRSNSIIKWGSEIVQIPYLSSVKGRMARYFPDIFVQYKNKHGEVITEIIEIKPAAETEKPKMSRNKSTNDYNTLTYITNMEKWSAAEKYCQERNIKFRLLTENQLFAG
jgi:hypothetical protein